MTGGWSWVTPRLAVGAGPTTPEHLTALTDMGVTHTLDLRERGQFPQELHAGRPESLRWAWNPADDDGEGKPVAWFARSLTFAWRTLGRPHQKLLVCCTSGVERSPATCYAILRSMGYMEYQAYLTVCNAHPAAELPPNPLGADRALVELGWC